MELCPLFPSRLAVPWAGIKRVKRQRVKQQQRHPKQTACSSGFRNSVIPARTWAPTVPCCLPDFNTALFCHFRGMKDFNNSKSQSMLSSYQPLTRLQGTAWAHTAVKLHFFSFPYKGTAFKFITRLHTWIAHWLSCILLHISSYFLSK